MTSTNPQGNNGRPQVVSIQDSIDAALGESLVSKIQAALEVKLDELRNEVLLNGQPTNRELSQSEFRTVVRNVISSEISEVLEGAAEDAIDTIGHVGNPFPVILDLDDLLDVEFTVSRSGISRSTELSKEDVASLVVAADSSLENQLFNFKHLLSLQVLSRV